MPYRRKVRCTWRWADTGGRFPALFYLSFSFERKKARSKFGRVALLLYHILWFCQGVFTISCDFYFSLSSFFLIYFARKNISFLVILPIDKIKPQIKRGRRFFIIWKFYIFHKNFSDFVNFFYISKTPYFVSIFWQKYYILCFFSTFRLPMDVFSSLWKMSHKVTKRRHFFIIFNLFNIYTIFFSYFGDILYIVM